MRKPLQKWATEVQMFAAFVERMKAQGWVCYPESCNFDLVLRAGDTLDLDVWKGVERGDLVAIEGKLRPSIEVLHQSLPAHLRYYPQAGAHWNAVLVPYVSPEFNELAVALGILVFTFSPDDTGWDGHPRTGVLGRWISVFDPNRAYRRRGVERRVPPTLICPLLAVEQAAGSPAPRAITPWKVAAVKLCLLALSRPGNELTSADFKAAGVNVTRWVECRWVEKLRKDGRQQVYALRANTLDERGRASAGGPRPDLCYPEIVAALQNGDGA